MTDPTPAEALKAEKRVHCHACRDGECFWSDCPQIRDNEPKATGRHCPLDIDCPDCGEHSWECCCAPMPTTKTPELALSPTPDAGEVRTYREGVEMACVADELANVPAVGRTPTDKFHNRIERTMARTIAAAIRKLP